MKTNTIVSAILLASSAALSAATYTANWMDLSVDTLSSTPIASNANIPQFSQFNLPGYGNVRVSISANPVFVTTGPVSNNLVRGTGALDNNGSITVGPDTLQWGVVDSINGVNGFGFEDNPDANYTVSFTFMGTVVLAPGELLLGVSGIGNNEQPSSSSITVNRAGALLGEFDLGSAYAPTIFTPGVGSFTLTNGTPSPSAGFFNTDFSVSVLTGPVNPGDTITLSMVHIDQDGFGANWGLVQVPEPSAAALLGLAGLGLLVRRRARP